MTDIYYSTDDEHYGYTDLRDAAEDVFSHPYAKIGDVVTIHSGESNRFNMSDFLRVGIEEIQERAWDELGEYTEDFLAECTKEMEDDLQKMVADAVDKWADKNKNRPEFFGIKNVKEVKLRFIGGDTDFYEVLGS